MPPSSAASRPASPAPPVVPTIAGATLIAGVFTLAVFLGRPLAAAVVFVVQVVLALGWRDLAGSSLGWADAGLVVAAAAAADIIELHSGQAGPGSLAPLIGVAFVAALLRQLARRPRTHVTRGLVGTVSGVALCCAPALLIPLGLGDTGRAVATAGLLGAAAALVLGILVRRGCLVGAPAGPPAGPPVRLAALPPRELAAGGAALVAGAAAAALISLVTAASVAGGDALGSGAALAVGLLSAAAAAVVCVATARGLPSGPVLGLRVVAACLPVVAALPMAYVAGRLAFG